MDVEKSDRYLIHERRGGRVARKIWLYVLLLSLGCVAIGLARTEEKLGR